MKPNAPLPIAEQVTEMLILPDGKIFVHNLTPTMARLLVALDPTDAAMLRRASQPAVDHPLAILPAV